MLMFTSAMQQEGKSTTLANLGVALAVTESCHPRRPTCADRCSPRSSASTG
jgi:Mrp family chromosome partitioning ATPase